MKRILLCFSVFLLLLSTLPAASWTPDTVKVGTLNDQWTMGGINRNDDDQYSYGIDFIVAAEAWELSLDFIGVTNRGWKDVWTEGKSDQNPTSWYEGRYDLIDLDFKFKTYPVDIPGLRISVFPYAGFNMVGNFGLEWVQNLIHKISHIHDVHIKYEPNGTYLFPVLGADISIASSFNFADERMSSSSIGISADFNTDNAIGYETSQYVGGSIFIERNKEKIINLSLGYKWIQQHTDWKTHSLAAWYYSGPTFSFLLNAGALTIDYTAGLAHRSGYTTIYVDIMSFWETPVWKESDISVRVGYARQAKRNFNNLQLGMAIGDLPLNLVVSTRYVAGNPLDPAEEFKADNHITPRKKFNCSSWTIGIEYESPSDWSDGWVSFFVRASMGIDNLMITTLTNTIKEEPLPSIDEADILFIADLEAGIALLPEGLLKAGIATYQLFVSVGVSYYPDGEAARYYLDKYDNGNRGDMVALLLPRATFGLEIGLDL